MPTVFDVATTLIERSGRSSMPTITLQKLCFYTFGWYAHLTGESLFPETFWAMEHGPVVGELLSAHSGALEVTVEQLLPVFQAWDRPREELSSYASAVVDAVMGYYDQFGRWDLEKKTHEETIWKDAWAARPTDSKRGRMTHQAIIAYFLARTPGADEHMELPPRLISYLSADDEARIEAESGPCPEFISTMRELRRAA